MPEWAVQVAPSDVIDALRNEDLTWHPWTPVCDQRSIHVLHCGSLSNTPGCRVAAFAAAEAQRQGLDPSWNLELARLALDSYAIVAAHMAFYASEGLPCIHGARFL